MRNFGICTAEVYQQLIELGLPISNPRKHPVEDLILFDRQRNSNFTADEEAQMTGLGVELISNQDVVQYLDDNGWNKEEC